MTWESEWAEWMKAKDDCLDNISEKLEEIGEAVGVKETEFFEPEVGQELVDPEYAMGVWKDVAVWLVGEIDLEMNNVDWPRLSVAEIKKEFDNALDSSIDYANWRCENAWKTEKEEPKKAPVGKAEEFAEELMAVFEKHDPRVKIPIKVRRRQADACKQAAKSVAGSFELCMKGKINKLR